MALPKMRLPTLRKRLDDLAAKYTTRAKYMDELLELQGAWMDYNGVDLGEFRAVIQDRMELAISRIPT